MENETQRSLLKKRLLSTGTAHSQVMEVLPISRRVLSVNGREVKRWISAAWTETAETPAFAAMAAEWLQPVAITEEAEVYSGQRELSEPEKEELKRIVNDLRRPMWPAILLTLWFSLVAGGYWLSGRTPNTGDFYRLGFLGVLALGNDIVFAWRLIRARRMAADLKQGFALILRILTKPIPEEDGTPEPPKEFEILPQSRALWTERGKPAPWRTSDSWLNVPRRVPK